jgi:hypothetical protein
MPTHKQMHVTKAKSVNVRIAKQAPKVARLDVMLASENFWSVEIPRHVLERLVLRIQRALREAPLPVRARSTDGRPATSRNK